MREIDQAVTLQVERLGRSTEHKQAPVQTRSNARADMETLPMK